MTEVIPSINVRTFAEVQERIKKIEPYVSWCHLDVTDGVFSTHPTWNNPEDLKKLDTKINAEIHLMTDSPENIIDTWLISGVKRIIVHYEAVSDINEIIRKCGEQRIEVGLAIKPETSWEVLKPWFDKVDLIQVLAVNPGPSGQHMAENTVEKIVNIRNACSQCMIEVDGGVNEESAKKVVEVGAHILVAGSALFSHSNFTEAIDALKI